MALRRLSQLTQTEIAVVPGFAAATLPILTIGAPAMGSGYAEKAFSQGTASFIIRAGDPFLALSRDSKEIEE